MTTPYVLARTQTIAADLPSVFAFFKNPRNLAEITPAWLRFHVREATDTEVREGTRIRYTIRWLGLPMAWESVIAEYTENVSFADEMIRGPYKRWYHIHAFRETGGGVEMSDRVEYELPFGPLGSAAHVLLVRRQLEAIFDYRERRISQIFVR